MRAIRTPGRAGRFVLVASAVAALHAALLWTAPRATAPAEPAVLAAALAVRSIEPLPPPAPAPTAAEAPVALPTPPRPPVAVRERRPAASPVRPTPSAAPVDAPKTGGMAALAAPVTTVDAPLPASMALPVYPTRLAAAGRWHYRLARGDAVGDAVLDWAPDGDGRYQLRLQAHAGASPLLDWVSHGAVDSTGIAPERFAVRRRGRDSMAANFQRDVGKVTWSGPTHEVPLATGAQDRLSWLVQLPAVLEGSPGRFGAGDPVVLMVIGARGGADVWTFEVQGVEVMDEVPALKLVRQARRPYDVQVQAWLDPARGHLPVRVLLTQPEGGAPFELRWRPTAPGSTGP